MLSIFNKLPEHLTHKNIHLGLVNCDEEDKLKYRFISNNNNNHPIIILLKNGL